MSDSQALRVGSSPEIFVQDIDRAGPGATLVRIDEARYREASFLDKRVLTPETQTRVAPWPELEGAAVALPVSPGPDYIFHLGHVGSTLISRILGDHPQILALREPPWIRTIAEATVANPDRSLWPDHAAGRLIPVLTRFAARTFRTDQRAMIKVSSFASELAPQLLAASTGARFLALVASPQIHMATLLARNGNRSEVDVMGPTRLLRLKRRASNLTAAWSTLSLGEKCGATWLSEMASLSAILRQAGPAGLVLDFDRFLADPRGVLAATLAHFNREAGAQQLDVLAASPHFSRYSKAQAHEYSPQLRQHLLSGAWTQHTDDIKKGLDWIKATIAASPDLASLLKPFWRG